MLGELHFKNHQKFVFDCSQSVAFVQQNAWIRNDTLRKNILFGLPFDSLKYQRVLKMSALYEDIKTFPNGDRTIVGEKAVTLSTGQKVRVSLARALYQERDMILYDDLLSSFDINVSDFIFKNVILGSKGRIT